MKPNDALRIEALGLSEKCLAELKRVGFTTVEEVIEFLEEHTEEDMPLVRWIPKCIDEITQQLKQFGYWSEKLELAWPSS